MCVSVPFPPVVRPPKRRLRLQVCPALKLVRDPRAPGEFGRRRGDARNLGSGGPGSGCFGAEQGVFLFFFVSFHESTDILLVGHEFSEHKTGCLSFLFVRWKKSLWLGPRGDAGGDLGGAMEQTTLRLQTMSIHLRALPDSSRLFCVFHQIERPF